MENKKWSKEQSEVVKNNTIETLKELNQLIYEEEIRQTKIKNKEEQIKEYVKTGGKLFSITSIDKIRDGGTIVLKTTKLDYYIHKSNKHFYYSYPLDTNENLITDYLLIAYLIDRINSYIEKREKEVEQTKNMLIEIQNIFDV